MARLPTVKVVNPSDPDDFMIINESDFDEGRHELWADEEATQAVDLREVPCKELSAALESVDDLSVVQAAAEADDRDCAEEHYQRRLAELAPEDEDEEGGE